MKKVLSRLILVGAAAGAVYALRNYLRGSSGPNAGDVMIVLDTGASFEPGSVEAREFSDIARKILEIEGL